MIAGSAPEACASKVHTYVDGNSWLSCYPANRTYESDAASIAGAAEANCFWREGRNNETCQAAVVQDQVQRGCGQCAEGYEWVMEQQGACAVATSDSACAAVDFVTPVPFREAPVATEAEETPESTEAEASTSTAGGSAVAPEPAAESVSSGSEEQGDAASEEESGDSNPQQVSLDDVNEGQRAVGGGLPGAAQFALSAFAALCMVFI